MCRMMILVAAWATPLTAVAGPPTGAAEPSNVPYRLTETKHVMVRVKLNGAGPFNFILDTGAPAVFVQKKLSEKLQLKLDNKGWGEIKTFDVEGGLSAGPIKCRVEDLFQLEGMNGLGLAGVELHGVIGYNVLAKYRITYDFTADRLVWVPLNFEPPAVQRIGSGGQGDLEVLGPVMKTLAMFLGVSPKFETVAHGRFGIEVEGRNDGVFVTGVLAGGPAEQAGLVVGDRISGIDGHPIDTVRSLFDSTAAMLADQKVKCDVVRGRTDLALTVTLGKGF